jgi:hypothetical protein
MLTRFVNFTRDPARGRRLLRSTGELLGLVLAIHLDVGIESQLEPLWSRVGADPLWVTGSVGSRLALQQFPLGLCPRLGISFGRAANWPGWYGRYRRA